jgi:hypothetical protein
MIRTPFNSKLIEIFKLKNCIKYMPVKFKIGIPYPLHNIKKSLGLCVCKNLSFIFSISASTVGRYFELFIQRQG